MQRCKEWGHDTTATGIYLFWMLDNEVSGQVIEPTKWGMVQASGGTTMKRKREAEPEPIYVVHLGPRREKWLRGAKQNFHPILYTRRHIPKLRVVYPVLRGIVHQRTLLTPASSSEQS